MLGSSSFSSGTSHDLYFSSGFIKQYHLSGSESGSTPSGSLRHFRQLGLSHCTQVWSGKDLQQRIKLSKPQRFNWTRQKENSSHKYDNPAGKHDQCHNWEDVFFFIIIFNQKGHLEENTKTGRNCSQHSGLKTVWKQVDKYLEGGWFDDISYAQWGELIFISRINCGIAASPTPPICYGSDKNRYLHQLQSK